MTTMNLSIFKRVSELTSTGCRDILRKASVTDEQELHANHADFFLQPKKLDTVSHPLISYHFAKSLWYSMRNVEQNARISLRMRTWLGILDIIHVILSGDDRFILCGGDRISASFASLYALGQIAKQVIFVSNNYSPGKPPSSKE